MDEIQQPCEQTPPLHGEQGDLVPGEGEVWSQMREGVVPIVGREVFQTEVSSFLSGFLIVFKNKK